MGPSEGRGVVLVEDDPSVLNVVYRWLRDAGYNVTSFTDYQTARAYLKEHAVEILVTDVRLEAFNGLQLLFVAQIGNPGVRGVVMSGFNDPLLRAEAEHAGAVYLQKPLEHGALLTAVAGDYSPERST